MSGELSEALLEAGLVTPEQVRAAKGPIGRAGLPLLAALIDLGLRPGALAGYFHHAGYGPWVSPGELMSADPQWRVGIPGIFCREQLALPLRETEQGVEVAMVAPTDPNGIMAVASLIGKPITVRVARLDDLLATLEALYPEDSFAINEDSGVIDLVQLREDATAAYEDPREASDTHDALPLLRQKTHTAPPSAGSSEGMQPPTMHGLSAIIAEGSTREEVIRAACEAAASLGRVAVLIGVRRGTFKGIAGHGEDLSADAVRNLWIPVASPSCMRDVSRTGQTYRGPSPDTPPDQLLRAVMRSSGRDLIIAPVKISGRVASLICVDEPHADADAPLSSLAVALSKAFARLITTTRDLS